jgi:hypothetical protein
VPPNGNGNGEGSAGPGTHSAGDGGEAAGDRLAQRMQSMSPEQREQFLQRMRERGFDPSARGGRGNAPSASGRSGSPTPTLAERTQGATTIDALFGPLQRVETAGRAWLYTDKQLKPIRLRLGITDGQTTEVIDGDVQEGTEVVTNIATANASTRPAPTAFPFGPQPGRGGFPGGGGGRGGR